MPVTPALSLPYPAPGDTPDVPFDMQALAEAVESAVDQLPTVRKAGKQSVTTNASGEYLLTHNLGVKPTQVRVTQWAGTASSIILVAPKIATETETTVTLVAMNVNANTAFAGSMTISWEVTA